MIFLIFVFMCFALDDYTRPVNFTDNTVIEAADFEQNNDSLDDWTARTNDSIDLSFVRFTDFKDSTIDTINVDYIRSNPDVDSISGKPYIDSIITDYISITDISGAVNGSIDTLASDSIYARSIKSVNGSIDTLASDSIYSRSIKSVNGSIDTLVSDSICSRSIKSVNGSIDTLASDSIYARAGAITAIDASTVDATTLKYGGTDINTGGALSNVAYLDQVNAFSTYQTIASSSNSEPALKITGTGTGDLVNLNNGTDNFFTIENDGDVNLSGNSGDTRLFIKTYSTDDADQPTIFLMRSYTDTFGVSTPTIDGNQLGEIRFLGIDTHNGGAYGAGISVVQAGAAGVAYVPANMYFYAASDAANPVRLTINGSTGFIGVGNNTNPAKELDVTGTIQADSLYINGKADIDSLYVDGKTVISENTDNSAITQQNYTGGITVGNVDATASSYSLIRLGTNGNTIGHFIQSKFTSTSVNNLIISRFNTGTGITTELVSIGFNAGVTVVDVSGRVDADSLDVQGYTSLGASAPRIMQKKLTGTTDADSQTSVTHGLTQSKILSVIVQISDGTDLHNSSNAYANKGFNYYVSSTEVVLTGVGSAVQSQTYTILITYEQ